MCLTVLDKNHHIAESDIICYKLFKIKSGKLVTKYQDVLSRKELNITLENSQHLVLMDLKNLL